MLLRLSVIVIFSIFLAVSATNAQDSYLDDLAGFEEDEISTEKNSNTSISEDIDSIATNTPIVDKLKSIFVIGGSIGFKAAINVNADEPKENTPDYTGLSMFQTSLYLNLKINLGTGRYLYASGHEFFDALYFIKDRDLYSKEYLDLYEQELKLDDLYFHADLLKHLSFSTGRQTIVWGNSDMFQVVDCINPLDMRTPGMIDIRDMRQPVFMSRIGLNFSKLLLEAILVHESRFNIMPIAGSSFFPYPITIPTKSYSHGGENSELALSAKLLMSGWDISAHYAYILNNSPYLSTDLPITFIELILNQSSQNLEMLSNLSEEIPLMQKHARIHLGGVAASAAIGNFMLKAEAAYLNGLKYLSRPNETLSRWDILLGTDYSGFKDMTLSLEFIDRFLLDHKELMTELEQINKHDFGWGLRINKNLLHNSLHLMGLLTLLGIDGSDGGFTRLSVSYDIADNLSTTLGTIIYINGDFKMYEDISKNNRITLEVKYSF